MTSQELVALKGMIADAEMSYHRLMVGTSLEEMVDQNGERYKYTKINRAGLYSYLQELKARLPSGDPGRPTQQTPLRFLF